MFPYPKGDITLVVVKLTINRVDRRKKKSGGAEEGKPGWGALLPFARYKLRVLLF